MLLRTINAHAELRRGEPGPQPHDDWLNDMIVVGVGIGLRRAELFNLGWTDTDLADRMLYVPNRDGFTTKSGHERPYSTLDTPVFLDNRDLPPKPSG